MTDEEKQEEPCCPACGKKFFFFSQRGEQGDMTLSIPAIDESNAMNILDDIVQEPEAWKREHDIEKQMNDKRTTGRRKEEPPGATGPMFG